MRIFISIIVTLSIEFFGLLFIRDWYKGKTGVKIKDSSFNQLANYLGLIAGIIIIIIGLSFPILFYINNKHPLPM
jgi:hypothetical protein